MTARAKQVWSFALEVQRRSSDRQGPTLAAAISMRGFLALFPLLVLAIGVLGFLSANTRDLASDIVDDLGLSGDSARIVTDALHTAQNSRVAASVVGVLGLLWTGTGLATVLTSTWNALWDIPGGGLRGRTIGFVWLIGGGVLAGAAFASTALVEELPAGVNVLGVAVGLVADTALFLWTAWTLPSRRIPFRAMLPGAIVGAIGFEILKLAGTIVVPRLVADSSALYGSIGVVFALLVWMLVLGRLVVYAVTTEVVAWEHSQAGGLQGGADQGASRSMRHAPSNARK